MAQGAWGTGTWDAALWDSLPVTGNSATGSPGNVGARSTVPLTGVSATGQVGTVSASQTIPLTGVSATAAVGNVGPTVTIALSGTLATGQVGTEGVSTTVPVTGIAATGAVGTVVPVLTVSLSGNDATGAVGTVTAETVLTVSLSGNDATGAVGTVTAGAPPIVIIDDTHDGRRFKEQLKRERKLREKKKQSIIDAFERIVEGRPEIAEEIAAPFIVPPIAKTAVKTINYDALFADLDRVQRIWDLHLELDDEDVLTLL
jgi:hypothetical protein